MWKSGGIIVWETVENDWAFPLLSLASGMQNAMITKEEEGGERREGEEK